MVPAINSDTVYGVSSRSNPPRTSERFISTAAMYQIAISAKTMVTIGAQRSTSGCCRSICDLDTGRASALLIIRVPRPQPNAHALRDLQKFRRLADLQGAVARKVAVDDIDDPARPRRHHHDPAPQKHRFGNRMGNEQDGLGG